MAKKDKIKVNYDNLRTGDIVLTAGRSIFSRGIKTVTKSKITHVGVVVDLYGVKVIAEMLSGGLVLNTFNRYTMSKKRDVVQVVRPLDLTPFKRSAMRSRVLEDWVKHIDYDWGGVFKFVFKRSAKNDAQEYFCSEYTAMLLDTALNTFLDAPGNIAPGDLIAGNPHFINEEIKWQI